MWRNLKFVQQWHVCAVEIVKCMLFCCKIGFILIYALLSQNLFCRNLRTFVWRKINQKLSPWRKNDKYQVCMICGQPLTITKSQSSYKTSCCEIGQKTGNQFCCLCRPVWSCPILSNPVQSCLQRFRMVPAASGQNTEPDQGASFPEWLDNI